MKFIMNNSYINESMTRSYLELVFFFFFKSFKSEALKDLSTSPEMGTFRSKVILWRISDSEYTSDMAL